MIIKKRSTGSIEDMMKAVQDRIDELSDSSIESSTKIIGSEKIYREQDGTEYTEQELRNLFEKLKVSDPVVHQYRTFESWVKDSLENDYLSIVDNADSCTSVKAAKNVDMQDYNEVERYIHTLIGDLDSALSEEGFNNTVFDTDDHNLYVTVYDTSEQYDVPFDDLTFDWDSIEKDVKYILDAIKGEVDTDFDDLYESDKWIELESKSVTDSDGFVTEYTLYKRLGEEYYICMFGDREVYTPSADYADAEFDDYDQAKSWFDNYTGFDDADYN